MERQLAIRSRRPAIHAPTVLYSLVAIKENVVLISFHVRRATKSTFALELRSSISNEDAGSIPALCFRVQGSACVRFITTCFLRVLCANFACMYVEFFLHIFRLVALRQLLPLVDSFEYIRQFLHGWLLFAMLLGIYTSWLDCTHEYHSCGKW